MNSNASNTAPIFATRQQVTAALQRAADKARLIAEQTGTKLIVVSPRAQGHATRGQAAMRVRDDLLARLASTNR